MPVKKRKLSPAASSRSSATPAPNNILDNGSSTTPQPASPPANSFSANGDTASLRSSAGAVRETIPSDHVERTVAKHGVVQPGTGDGADCGDECFMWSDLPMNKHGFRYVACAPSPISSPSPLHPFYRQLPPPPPCPPVHISWVDRSPFLRISPDGTTCTTDRGFRAGRANMSVREGQWYFECRVLRGTSKLGGGSGTGGDAGNPHVRVGWGRREALMDAPVGADGYSYGIRDVGGEAVHISRPHPYGQGFGEGDVVGCMISLPRLDGPGPSSPRRVPIRYKGQLYFEIDDMAPVKEMEALLDREGKVAAAKRAAEQEAAIPKGKGKKTKNAKLQKPAPAHPETIMRPLSTLPGSRIDFFINGSPCSSHPAYVDIYDFRPLPPLPNHKPSDKDPIDDGSIGYYPMISCFGRGKVQLNFGPDFCFSPPAGARGMYERAAEFKVSEDARDTIDETALAIRLEKDMAETRVRMEKAEKKIAVQAAKKAKAEARVKARVSETPMPGVPGIPSSLAYEVHATPEAEVEADGVGEIKPLDAKVEQYEIQMDGQWDGPGNDTLVKQEMQSRPATTPSSPAPLDMQMYPDPDDERNDETPVPGRTKKGTKKAQARIGRSPSAGSASALGSVSASRAASMDQDSVKGERDGHGPMGMGDVEEKGGIGGDGANKDADGDEEEGVQW